MMLVLGDGTKSLDYLRSDSKNNHHGLDFTTGCNAKSASTALALVENSRVEILPHGHFSNLYKTLPQVGAVFAAVSKSHGPTSTTSMQTVCVLQAKEYFDAARGASLFTRPNHSYYGSVALASVL